MQKTLLATAVSLGLTSFTAGASDNSPYNGMYSFGDSLFDNGQFGVRFTNRVGPDYQTSEFGPVSPDLVASGLGLPVPPASRFGGTNYAAGSNRSIDTLDSITAATTYTQAYSIGEEPDGRDNTFNSLFYNLQLAGQNLDTNALYLLDGGGNDIGDLLVFNDEQAGVVATNLVNAAAALQQRGAKYVVIANVPDFGLAPAGVSFGDFGSILSGSINRQLNQQLGAANVLIFDSYTTFQEIAADPSAYGFNLSSEQFSRACFDSDNENCAAGNASAKIDGSSPDPDQFFFNDPLHPTTIGQTIFADYMLAVLKAPGEIALLPYMGVDDMQAQWRAATPVMRSNRWNNHTDVGDFTIWGGYNVSDNERDTQYNDTANNDGNQYGIGFNYRFSDLWYLGGMVSRADNELDFDTSASTYDMESLGFSLLSGFRGDHWFAEGMLSYADLNYDDLNRSFTLGPVKQRTETASTDGQSMGVMVNAGYNIFASDRSLRLGPLVGYEYVRVEVDGYREDGSDATALNVDDQDVGSSVISLGGFASLDLGLCDCELYTDVVYRKNTSTDPNDPRIGLVSVEGNMATLPGYQVEDDDSWRWNLGLAANFTPAVQFNISAGGEDSDDQSDFWYGAELSYSF